MLAALVHGDIRLVGGDGTVGRAHDPVAGDHLLDAVGAPAGNTGGGEQRREHLLRDAQHGIHQAGVHIHIGTHGRVAVLAFHDHGQAQLLHLLQQGEVVGVALQLRHALGVLLQQHRPGVGDGIHRVAQTVQLAGPVAGLLVQQGGDLAAAVEYDVIERRVNDIAAVVFGDFGAGGLGFCVGKGVEPPALGGQVLGDKGQRAVFGMAGQRVSAAFRKLAELRLIWEKRCGRGDANQIYLACVQPMDDPDYQCAPFMEPEECGTRTADIAALDPPEPQDRRFKNGENSSSRTADAAPAEPQNLRPSYTDKRKNDESYIEVSPSVTEGPDEEELTGILDACELSSFEPEMARIFETAIERLFYSDSFRVGNATLPQSRVRHRLHDLDNLTLRDTEQRLRANQERNIRNSIQYTMAVLFNCITEGESDLVVDPYLNSLGGP